MTPDKCSYCGHKEFFKTEEGDIACSKCGLIAGKEEQQGQHEPQNQGQQQQNQQPTEQQNQGQSQQQNPEHNQGQQPNPTQQQGQPQPKANRIKAIEEIKTKTIPIEEIRKVIDENKNSEMLTGMVHLGDLFGSPPTEVPKIDAGYLAVHVADYYDENHNLEKFTIAQLGHTIFFTIETINLRNSKPTPKEMQLLKGLSIIIMAKIERGDTI